ncbi:MAG: hypothetical protein UV61_C0021G0013 [Candidatus Gottesmanbacteria bacterium GW2011_GWB1_43_11]|uniref:YYY membrane protein n=1 Tax=Candidatus Gottesmanbacteria bacterium GW2011_GWB1_43_11 TaxID=1618446 RepID=A0A0G1CHY3_9BACT|nr:MAG: hypothetical protein UV17_C0023G0008 [Candidatus Gottesmanbacteria bacterium GW2011_GWA1_42_26]KKS80869.1 MAG: hypothetical protein UV55_C0027G0009 [Candidatus Gottesmanbacteria bacterium GW2011_GWC1_43_10]KKS85097.1 MAG: hypothetical protein UV61_C0021G0013 [Candidatus Gottesmanbacteria bacterium GW2011_GWB1_43_11]OGG07645.1 MAG: hypothetical protein A2699_06140 [Candidatus Gottesmanbacteria bacterium RIFCSPHIGHO2_01_FULL_43_15]HCM38292.1 hypothetical protein [Patescibacteria group bac
MLGTVFLFITSLIVGKALFKFLRIQLQVQWVGELVVGIVATTLILFFLGFVFPLNSVVLGIELGICTLLALSFLRLPKAGRPLDEKQESIQMDPRFSARGGQAAGMTKNVVGTLKKINVKNVLLWTFFIVLVVWLFGRALYVSNTGQITAGDRLVWTDWPVHLSIASSFAWGKNFPPQNPNFAGIPLVYPFFADFLSGILLVLGASYPLAFAVPGVVLTLAFFGLFVGLAREFFDKSDNTNKTYMSFGALFLSIFWGGLGWVYWLAEVFSNETQFVSRLLAPIREYTFWQEKGLWFFTFLYSEILPQRAFLFGLPIFFLVLWLLWKGWSCGAGSRFAGDMGFAKQNSGTRGLQYYVVAGVFAGISPFFHTHTFLSLWFLTLTMFGLGGIGVILVNKGDKRNQGLRKRYLEAGFLFFLPFAALTLVQLPLFHSQFKSLPFEFGWMKGSENFFLFWFKNTGLFIPLVLLGLWKGKFGKLERLVGVSSWALFILPNLFRFAPWGYDNLKIFTYWYLLNAPFVMGALIWMWNLRRIRFINRIGVVLIFVSLTLSGVVEVGRLLDTGRMQIGLWSQEDQKIAQEIRQTTSPDSVFLTAAIHDHPVATLAGRKIVIGFPGNMWSWGIVGWSEREQDVHAMYRGGETAQALWRKYGISYIAVGDRERYFEPQLNEGFIAQHADLLLENGGNKIYKIK